MSRQEEELKSIVVPNTKDDDDEPQQETSYSRKALDSSIFIDVEVWAQRFGIVGLAFGVLAATVPQYIYTVPSSVTFGMRATCFGDRCKGLDFSLLRSTLNCKSSCDDALDQFRLRWRTIEGFSWMGVVFSILLAALLRVGYTREVRATALGAGYFAPAAARLGTGDIILLQAADSVALLPVRPNDVVAAGVVLDTAAAAFRVNRSAAQRFSVRQAASAVAMRM
jgi:hypothetical protein